MTATYYAHVNRPGGDGFGCSLKAATERAAKAEARRIFAEDYTGARIYLFEVQDGTKRLIASAPVRGGQWQPLP